MKKKILIIEDEKILGEMYRDKFIQAGFGVDLFEMGGEALKEISKGKPDLILLDILLPKENGISFLRKLRKKRGLALIPVVVFSNYDDQKTKEEALKLGVKEYLIKTAYTPKEIINKVKSYLKGQ